MSSVTELSTVLASCIAVLRAKLGQLDQLLESVDAIELEGKASPLRVSLNDMRQWKDAMYEFASGCVTRLLELFSQHIAKLVAKARSLKELGWDACFNKDGDFLEDMAVKKLRGKLPVVVNSHNELHAALCATNEAGKIIDVVPKVKVHDITSTSIATALKTMQQLEVTSVVIHGCQLLSKYKYDATGAAKASAFLAEHEVEKNSSIPKGFWDELRHMTTHTVQSPSAPKLAVKSEQLAPSTSAKLEPIEPDAKRLKQSGDGQDIVPNGASSVKLEQSSEIGSKRGPKRFRKN